MNALDNQEQQDQVSRELLRSVDRFIENELASRARDIDENDSYPWDLHEKAAKLGLFAIALPEKYGGLGLGLRTRLELIERIARCSGSFAVIISTWADAVPPIIEHGSDALKTEVLPKVASGEWCPAIAISEPEAGSDAAAMTTRAERVDGGWILSGSKTWCTHGGMADIVVVFAKSNPNLRSRGISAFMVRKGAKGFSVVRDEKLISVKGSPQSTLQFDRCFVPDADLLGEEGDGWKTAMVALDEARLNVSADPERAVGPTAASSATVQAREELFPVYGYADETLMKDMRFKLGHALRNAGLNGTEYARDLLASNRWGGPSRPDAVTTNFSLGYDDRDGGGRLRGPT